MGKKIIAPKACDWTWHQMHSDKWMTTAIPDGDTEAPRITMSSKDSKGQVRFFCYRNGRYLGSHASLDDAKERCWIGERTRESEVFIAFQYEHPGVIPPGLPFTPAEYHEWKRHNPGGPGTAHSAEKVERATKRMEARAERIQEKTKDMDTNSVIQVLKPQNPKKEGTGPYKRWSLLLGSGGKTVAAYLGAKGNPTTLANAIKSGHVALESNQAVKSAPVETEEPKKRRGKK